MKSAVFVTKPRGAEAKHRYLVVQVAPEGLRMARTDHPGVASAIAGEWRIHQYSYTPGEIRAIHSQEAL